MEGAGPGDDGSIPSKAAARMLAAELLADQGTRLAHVLTAGRIADVVGRRLAASGFLTSGEAHLLVVAATVHDIGYAPRIAHSGFHPYDGAAHLRDLGWSDRLSRLVAHHSCALVTAPHQLQPGLTLAFPHEPGLLPDSLTYADMHSSPRGRLIGSEERLADIALRHAHPRKRERESLLREALDRVRDALRHPEQTSRGTAGPRSTAA